MGNYLMACSVKMDKVNAIYHSRTDDDDWNEFLAYKNDLYQQLISDRYNAYLMGDDEKGRKNDTMVTALMRFISGQTEDGEEQSKYGYLYLALCRLLGKNLEPDYKMISENVMEVSSFFRKHAIDIDVWNIAYRYDENIPFKEPSRNAMWPLIGYYKNNELSKQLQKIPAELYGSNEFTVAYVSWLQAALANNEDLVLFYF